MMGYKWKDLHILPKVRDSWSYLYVEHCRVDQEEKAIAVHDVNGKVPVPCASLALLMLGPGTTVTHAAMRTLAENGCSVLWTGEEGVRCYAQGLGETRSAQHLLLQARLWADQELHLRVVRKMYQMRFPEPLQPSLSLQQIRGKEGIRVRESYARASRATGVAWEGRSYERSSWGSSAPVNRALSAANSCLYGVCHAAIISAGYSPALGFIHTGKQLSFVYDIADLYKADLTIPSAFAAAAVGGGGLEGQVRKRCRDLFREKRLLERVVADIDRALSVAEVVPPSVESGFDSDEALPGGLWDPHLGQVEGGVNQAEASGQEWGV